MELTKLFALDIDAERTSILANLNRSNINRYSTKLHERITQIFDREPSFPKGIYEVGESYFGPRRVKGERRRGAGNKNTSVWNTQKRRQGLH